MKSRQLILALLFGLLLTFLVTPAKQMLLRQQAASYHNVLRSQSASVGEFLINGLNDTNRGIQILKQLAEQYDVNVFYSSTDSLITANASDSSVVFLILSDPKYLDILPLSRKLSLSEFNQIQQPISNSTSNPLHIEIMDIGWKFYLAPIDLYDGESFSGVVRVGGFPQMIEKFRNDFQMLTQTYLLPYNQPEIPENNSQISFQIMVNTLLQNWMIVIVSFLLIIITVYVSYSKRKDTAVKRLHGFSSLSIAFEQTKDMLTIGLLLILPIYFIVFVITNNLSLNFALDVLPHFLSLFLIVISFIFIIVSLSGVVLSLIRPADVLKNYGRNDGFIWIMTMVKVLILLLVLKPITNTIFFVDYLGSMIQTNRTYSQMFSDSYTLTAQSDSFDQLLRASEQIYPILNESSNALAMTYSVVEGSEELGPYRAYVNRNYIRSQKLMDEQGNLIDPASVNESTIIVSQSLKETIVDYLSQSPDNCRNLIATLSDCKDLTVIYTDTNVTITPYFYTYDPPEVNDLDKNFILIPYDATFPIFNVFFELEDANLSSVIIETVDPFVSKNRVMMVNLAVEMDKQIESMIGQLAQSILLIIIYFLMILSVLAGIYLMLFDSRKRICAIKYTFGIRSWQTLLEPLLIQMFITQVIILLAHRFFVNQDWTITLLASALIALLEISLFLLMSRFIESRLSGIVKRGI
ncbi:MAG: hypothetical protein CVU85_07360 [Firmicutes bacterium HGW-Firmicutes-10]|jgi:hypothetical protein|nr:MAG: hypothetical protein CVU85_07360 [Firmicutes bacterium HGW-Firmicutes-10]